MKCSQSFDADMYECIKNEVVSHDGVHVPLYIWRNKSFDGTDVNATRPLLLHGYGSYGTSTTFDYSIPWICLMDQGWSVATAHVRGGGELGRDWHLNGIQLKKKNTFEDFIACGKYLIENKYCEPGYLVARGSSAGGLLVGSSINQNRDLFGAACMHSPFVDIYNTLLDDTYVSDDVKIHVIKNKLFLCIGCL